MLTISFLVLRLTSWRIVTRFGGLLWGYFSAMLLAQILPMNRLDVRIWSWTVGVICKYLAQLKRIWRSEEKFEGKAMLSYRSSWKCQFFGENLENPWCKGYQRINLIGRE